MKPVKGADLKKRLLHFLVLLILCVLSVTLIPHAASAAAADAPVQKIRLPFVSVGNQIFSWDFPYSDDFFLHPADDFSLDLARASMALTVSAFRYNGDPIENQFAAYLGAAGFTEISSFGYDQPTSKDTLSGIIASRKIGDFTLIAAAPNGWKYKNEWSSNLEVGTGERHAGFDYAAKIMERKIDEYIRDHGISGRMKLWISGFSRAAAVGNLTAADMIGTGRFDDVYAYLFGVPRTAKNAERLPGIYNICGKYDPVTQVAPQSWGFERFGTDLYTPAEETATNYTQLLARASEVCKALTGHAMHNNPEINYQLHMILEFVYEMFPEPADYAEEFQSIIVRTWSDKSLDNLLETLLSGIRQLEKLDSRQEYSSRVLEDYLSYVLSQHLDEKDSQAEKGRWDRDLTLTENIMLEHMPYTYISWLFSDIPLEDLLHGHAFTRRVVIEADADVEVLKDGEVIGGADRQGNVLDQAALQSRRQGGSGDGADDAPSIFTIRTGSKTVLNLPMNGDYRIRIRSYGPESMLYYDVFCSPYTTFGSSDRLYVYSSGAGVRELQVVGAEPLVLYDTVSGRKLQPQSFSYEYSPTVLMADEASSSYYITVSDLVRYLVYAALITAAVLLICLIIYLAHGKGRRMGIRYSEMYIIIPHIVLIALYALLTQFYTVNVFSIGMLRSVFAGLTVFVIFLLALRGTLRDPCRKHIVLTVCLFLIAAADAFLYQRSTWVSASGQHFFIYILAVVIMTVLAVRTFYRKHREYMKDPVRNPTRVY